MEKDKLVEQTVLGKVDIHLEIVNLDTSQHIKLIPNEILVVEKAFLSKIKNVNNRQKKRFTLLRHRHLTCLTSLKYMLNDTIKKVKR